jgi:hypothetical protein
MHDCVEIIHDADVQPKGEPNPAGNGPNRLTIIRSQGKQFESGA